MVTKLIILLVIVLGVIAMAQLVRLNELARKNSGLEPGEVPNRDNKLNANLMLAFMIFFYAGFIYLMLNYGWTGRGAAASSQGATTDWLLDLNFVIVCAIFFLTNTLLFVFGWKYVRKPGVKAVFFSHSNKLEFIWTVIPAVVLAIIIILGLRTWNDITEESADTAERVELFSYQFGWKARYAGQDNELGQFDYKLTTSENEFALMTRDNIEKSFEMMKVGTDGNPGIKLLEEKLNDESIVMSKAEREKFTTDLGRKQRMVRLLEQMSITYNDSIDASVNNDILSDTLVLLKGQNYEFNFRSKDVIHSAYLPHFRSQMNTVPGLTTRMKLQPIFTTEEMRTQMNDEEFDYILMCNKICGGSHYKMKMEVTVLGADDYCNWMLSQPRYDGKTYFGYDVDPTKVSAADKAKQSKQRAELLESFKAIETSLESAE